MAYETYTTEALVCGTKNRNTADRSYLLFTREAGMLFADARSVREERSRQRYALQDFSLLRVSLVRGKAGWRVGSIEPVTNYYQQAADQAARGSVVGLVRLARRFLHGEEPARELFDLLRASLDLLCEPATHRQFVEQVLQVRMLALLGYVDKARLPAALAEASPSELARHHTKAAAARVATLYTQAVNVSHL